ncbi:MAG: aminotransferase [Rhodovulum sulfidophilum]|uniref:Aminotransferase n=1 Tax=Rhodovulum sulfidophilum TaxID=35806 RepID=A0A2W5NB03_RHOSU|nr:MAG: aminotransferase [Rhodovulum sulfidophilum]
MAVPSPAISRPPAANPLLAAMSEAPIPAAATWLRDYDGGAGPVIDLSQAVPGQPPEAALLAALGAAAASPEAARYGAILGDDGLRAALARDIALTYGGAVAAGDVAITSGCNQAFFVAMLALARAGDEVILPTPWYFNYKMTLDMLGVTAVPLPCDAARGFVPDPETVRGLAGPRTRAIVLISPNNPTGAVYDEATIAAFHRVAAETGIRLVLDETYRDFLPAERAGPPHGLFARPDWRDHFIHLYSFSKSCAVPGHRLGAVVAGQAVLTQIVKVMDSLQICAARTGQIALAEHLPELGTARARLRETFNRRAHLFTAEIARAEGWEVASIGAYFAYIRHPFAVSGEEVARRLARRSGVLCLPGSFFGPGQDQYLRAAFANAEEDQLRGLARRLADGPSLGN